MVNPRRKPRPKVRQELSAIVLVEVLVRSPDHRFDVGDFTQPQAGVDPALGQVAWNEVYLSADGAKPMSRPARGALPATLRLAFFLHFRQAAVPLRSSYGELACPVVQDLPDRLARLVPYVGVA